MKKLNQSTLTLLAMISGICGISYELLYAKILSLYFGNMFYISGALLSTFLLGIAAGSWNAIKFYKKLWLIEFLIGLYAFIIFFLNHFGRDILLVFSSQGPESSPALLVLKIILILALPAFLMGFSVPSFSILMKKNNTTSFIRAYKWYNLGAGACILILELLVIRTIGLEYSLLLVALLNIAIAYFLYGMEFPEEEKIENNDTNVINKRDLSVIFVLGVLSGISQIQLVNYGEVFWGPFNENFSIFLSLSLLSLWFASIIIERWNLDLENILSRAYYLFPLAIILVPSIVILYVKLATEISPPFYIFLKILFMGIMFFIPFLVFASVLPSYLQNKPNNLKIISYTLGISALGNAFGYLLSILILFELLSSFYISFAIALLLFICRFIFTRASKKILLKSSVFLLCILPLLYQSTNNPIYGLSYIELKNYNALNSALGQVNSSTHYQKFNTKLTITDYKDGTRLYIINGYKSLVAKAGKTIPHEVIFGILPTLYTESRENALVLGVGQGITAGTVAQIFNSSKAIEISPAVLLKLASFKENNFDLLNNKNSQIINEDALTYLLNSKSKYPLIISTVTSPIFFSSSKLYTKDFFELVKSRLTPDGVFAFWFDSQIPQEGISVIFETIKESFNECHLAYIKLGYAEVICGQRPLTPKKLRNSDLPENIRKIFKDFYRSEEVITQLNYLIFNKHNIMTKDWGNRPNTFDLPILEFIISNWTLNSAPKVSPFLIAEIDYGISPFSLKELSIDELIERCFSLHVIGYTMNTSCTDFLSKKNGGKIPPLYNKKVQAQHSLFK